MLQKVCKTLAFLFKIIHCEDNIVFVPSSQQTVLRFFKYRLNPYTDLELASSETLSSAAKNCLSKGVSGWPDSVKANIGEK